MKPCAKAAAPVQMIRWMRHFLKRKKFDELISKEYNYES
jgi:hypothetical protein